MVPMPQLLVLGIHFHFMLYKLISNINNFRHLYFFVNSYVIIFLIIFFCCTLTCVLFHYPALVLQNKETQEVSPPLTMLFRLPTSQAKIPCNV